MKHKIKNSIYVNFQDKIANACHLYTPPIPDEFSYGARNQIDPRYPHLFNDPEVVFLGIHINLNLDFIEEFTDRYEISV